MTRWAFTRFDLVYLCTGHPHASCSGRQMRNGLLTLNLLVWVVIILAIARFS